ncbi:hypothetical protein GCM10009120_29870 [Sphingobacterium siyangense subsp. cladoniae]|uniref:non-homologous end-joining DNA ligase LigD n=1 Tax=Sphingobacterium siyangense TaxID=459529 RepID=UPI0031FA0C52
MLVTLVDKPFDDKEWLYEVKWDGYRAVSFLNAGKVTWTFFNQNRPHATIASVYSVRPKPGATVSMPLHWDEVKKGLKMSDFHIFNALERISSEGDIFKPVLGKGIDLKKAIQQYSEK